MTKRPSDDFQISDRNANNEIDFGDDDAAAFGTENDAATDASETPAPLAAAPASEPDLAEQYDDSDFVMDDADDVIDEEAEQEYAEYVEGEGQDDELHDPLAEEDPYPTTEEIYDTGTPGKQGFAQKLKSMKKGDFIFYGGLGVIALGALYAAFAMTMGKSPEPTQNILTSEAQQSDAMPAGEGQIPNDTAAPVEKPAEPQPDAVGIQGAQSTLKADTMEPLPPAAPEAPAAVAAQPDVAPIQPQQAAPVAAAPAGTPVVEEQPVAIPAAPVAASAQAPLPAAIPDEVRGQLEAQQQALNTMQAQMEAQQKVMQKVQEQAALAMASPRSTATVTAPPATTSKDPALNEVATDLKVRITEVNAKLTQLSDTINSLQKTATKLDKQNADLVNKTKDLQDKVGSQSGKLTELANKEPTPSADKATIEELKNGVSQLERKLSAIAKTQGELKNDQEKLAGRAANAQAVANITAARVAAPTSATSMMPPSRSQNVDIAEDAAEPTHTLKVPPSMRPAATPTATITQTAPAAAPRSPKARDLAGVTPTSDQSNTWVLRAATPTMAWLSPRAGSAELKRVAPGDRVDGIGQILEIKQDLGKWTVVGTEGSIR